MERTVSLLDFIRKAKKIFVSQIKGLENPLENKIQDILEHQNSEPEKTMQQFKHFTCSKSILTNVFELLNLENSKSSFFKKL